MYVCVCVSLVRCGRGTRLQRIPTHNPEGESDAYPIHYQLRPTFPPLFGKQYLFFRFDLSSGLAREAELFVAEECAWCNATHTHKHSCSTPMQWMPAVEMLQVEFLKATTPIHAASDWPWLSGFPFACSVSEERSIGVIQNGQGHT